VINLDPWYVENIVCPVDHSALRVEGNFLVSANGRHYPVVEGMPVMLRDDVKETIGVARTSLDLAVAIANGNGSGSAPLYVETLGVTDKERQLACDLRQIGGDYDPVVAVMIGATSGFAYKHLIGVSASYPIPAFRFSTPQPGQLLDIGCNWGRWTIAAAQAGHSAVGIDPQLGAVLAARRVAAQLGVSARFIVGDARYLPFRPRAFDYAWSYSVLQHFARSDARSSLAEIERVMRPSGLTRIQMANRLGIRSLYHMARRRFQEPSGFDVRYWSPRELKAVFTEYLGATKLNADCFLGLGLQWSDFERMNSAAKSALVLSEILRRSSEIVPPLRWFADSLFCTSTTRDENAIPSGSRM